MRKLVADAPGLGVGHAGNGALGSGLTAVVFDRPAAASVAIRGGAPGMRDTALLEPGMTVEAVDALVLSGGSAFGLHGMDGAMAALFERGRGFRIGPAGVPIVPGAALFDLANGGDEAWGRRPPCWDLGHAAVGTAASARDWVPPRPASRAGSASAITPDGFVVGALAALDAALSSPPRPP